MSGILKGFLEIFKFFGENIQVIKDNWLLFTIWTIIWVGLIVSIYEYIRKKDKKKHDEDQEEISRLKQSLVELSENSWLNGSNIPPNNSVAHNISEHFTKSKK